MSPNVSGWRKASLDVKPDLGYLSSRREGTIPPKNNIAGVVELVDTGDLKSL